MRFRTLGIAVTLASAPLAALAAELFSFNVAAQPLPQALLAFATQANISIEASAARACRPTAGLHGRYDLAEGLRRVLAGTGCGFRLLDARTVVITRVEVRTPPPAAPPPPPSFATDLEMQEVVVTSPKRSTALSRAPYAVSVVSGGDLVTAVATVDTQALATRVAGMTVTNLGAGRDKVFLRGMSDGPLTGRTQSPVGIYLDDARIIYNAPDPDLRLTDIDRVEVLRGPQGSLYGAGSMGGVIQIITRRPDLDTFGGFVTATATATADGAPGGVVEGAVNVPVVPGKFAARLAVYDERIGGFVDDPGRGLKNLGTVTRRGVRGSLLFEPTDRFSLRFTYVDQGIHSNDSQYSEGETGSLSRLLALREPYRNDFDGVVTVADVDLGWARLKLADSAQWHTIGTRNDATLSLPFFSPTAAGPALYTDNNRIGAQVDEITLASTGEGRLTWLVGLFMSEYGQHLDSGLTTDAQGSLYSEARHDDIDERAAYGEATLSVTERLRITLGGRFYHLSTGIRSAIQQPENPDRVFSDHTSDHGFAPKAVVEFDLAHDTLVYVSSAVGYRPGGFNSSSLAGQVFSIAGGGPQPYRQFTGDELTSFEAGLKVSLLDRRLRLRLAAFSALWQNIQGDRLLSSGLPFTANLGDGHNAGVEGEAVWHSGSLRLNAEILLNHPELSRPDPGFPTPIERGLPGVPDVIWSAGARREWMSPSGATGWLGADLGYVGRSRLTLDQALAPQMGGYFTSRLHAGYSAGQWQVTAFVDNPLAQKGDTFAFGNPFRVRFESQHTTQRPVNAGVALTRNF